MVQEYKAQSEKWFDHLKHSHCSPDEGQHGPKPPQSVSACGLPGHDPALHGCAQLDAEPRDVPHSWHQRLALPLLPLSPPPPQLGFSSCPCEPKPCGCPEAGPSTILLSSWSTSLCLSPRRQPRHRQQGGHPKFIFPGLKSLPYLIQHYSSLGSASLLQKGNQRLPVCFPKILNISGLSSHKRNMIGCEMRSA